MDNPVYVETYEEPEIDIEEAIRYAGAKEVSADLKDLLDESMEEAREVLTYRVCYSTLPISIDGDEVVFPFGRIASRSLSLHLENCSEAVVFAGTVGLGIDRLISRYSRLSPAKGVMLQGIGTERIEALCDVFCRSIDEKAMEAGRTARPRFSPGYGDMPIEYQKVIFDVLDCSRKIGLTLNESMLMSPSKSVTAIVGIADECGREELPDRNCNRCKKMDCEFRL